MWDSRYRVSGVAAGEEPGLFGTSLSIVARGLNCDPEPPQFRRRLGRVSQWELPGMYSRA
jgi:hypothetical protein